MRYLQEFRSLFIHAGVSSEEYNELRPSMRRENRKLLVVFSLIGAVMFFILFITSLLSKGFASINSTTYLLSGILMLVIWACVYCFSAKMPAIIIIMAYVFEITLYSFGIHISMLHPDKPAVSAVAFLLVSPLLFYDRPVRLSALIAAVVTVFCFMVVAVKDGDVADTDIWNAVTFGIVAIATTIFIMSIKMNGLAQAGRLEYVSQTDILTGLKNRNHFEAKVQEYPELCSTNLICVYGDVNGLHEINNTQGHVAGDKMLREVAKHIRQCFGSEHSFRVGGDEFVAFRVDTEREDVACELEQIEEKLGKNGYHVSFGVAFREKAEGGINMHDIVKEAERNMYAAKERFYHNSENNRRNR